MDKGYIESFVAATRVALVEMFGIEIECMTPNIIDIESEYKNASWDFIANIAIGGDFTGLVTLNFEKSVASRIAAIVNERENPSDEEIADVVSEIVNIIAGRAKANMQDEYNLADKLVIALPIVTSGKDVVSYFPKNVKRLIDIPFGIFGDQRFEVCVAFSTRN
jgi:CheY-specific phosphatase CheX